MQQAGASLSLAELLADAGIGHAGAGAAGLAVTRVDHDSRECVPGSVFVAVPGLHTDGHRHAREAVDGGAVAVVAERPPDPAVDPSVPVLIVEDSRAALSALASACARHPSRSLHVAGITGTDGKTTTATLLWSAWRAAGIAAASVTTVDRRTGDDVAANPSRQTTPEAPEIQRHLAEVLARGCTHVALETSSHALDLHRVDDVDFSAAVFTRVTTEHLELHGTRDAYLGAKARLLHRVSARPDGVAVLDATDSFAFPRLLAVPVARRLTYSDVPAIRADLEAGDLAGTPSGVRFTARTPWGRADVRLTLSGRFNVRNALAALAAACSSGAGLEDAVRGVEALPGVSGRMERIDLGQPFAVIVDYAHTAGALETVLGELRETTEGRLWVVFGSAGERDVEKRAAMGAVAARLADVSVITDEDPRREDRHRILEQIAAGATGAGGVRSESVVVVPDRAEAIAFAIGHARPGDTVLCAGKGHERSLIEGTHARPWNERQTAETAIRARLGARLAT